MRLRSLDVKRPFVLECFKIIKKEICTLYFVTTTPDPLTLFKAPCKRTQHVGATWHNIVGIVLANVGFRVFKRSQHVGQCCFFGNTDGSLVWYPPKTLYETAMLSRSSAIMALDEYRRWKTRKWIAIAIALCHFENTPSHINKNPESLSNELGREHWWWPMSQVVAFPHEVIVFCN